MAEKSKERAYVYFRENGLNETIEERRIPDIPKIINYLKKYYSNRKCCNIHNCQKNKQFKLFEIVKSIIIKKHNIYIIKTQLGINHYRIKYLI